MRIRAKLTLMEMIVVVGFIVAVTVMFYYSRIIIQMKDFEIQSQKILSTLERIEMKADGLLTTNDDIINLKNELVQEIITFNRQLKVLQNFEVVNYLPPKDKKDMEGLINEWISLYDLYYLSTFKLLDSIIATPHINDFGNIGLLNIRKALYNNRIISNEELNTFYKLEGAVKVMNMKTAEFAEKGRNFMNRIKRGIKDAIRKSIMSAALIGLASIMTAFIIMVIFARRMGKRILLMHNAIQSVAEGDFSTTLTISSGDEFEEFAKHYNMLKEELWSKLDSVLDFMKEIGGSISISNLYNLDRIIEIVIKSAVKNTGADAGAVFMISEEDENLVEKRTSIGYLPPFSDIPEDISKDTEAVKAYEAEHPLTLEGNIIGEAILNGESVFIRDSREAEETGIHTDPGDPLYISSLAVVPLVITGRVLGAIAIAKTKENTFFTDIDFSHLKTFSDYAALTIDTMFNYKELTSRSELYREIEIAADIQHNLLPVRIPESKTLDVAAFSQAAKGVSGDYYDVFRLTNDKIAVLICDVVGKGVPAALLMVMIRTIIRLVASPSRNAEQILTILNRGITSRVEVDQFATMSFLIFNEKTRELEYANAAHSPMLHYIRRRGRFEEVDAPGLPIGIESSEQYTQELVSTEEGDIIILYTDGITEARNPDHEEYSQFSLQRIIKNNSSHSASKLIELIKADIKNFVGLTAQHDDQTIIVMKVK